MLFRSSTLISEEINENYENLKVEISTMDAEMKEMVENSSEKVMVVSTDKLNFLTKYGLTVYSLDENSINDKTLTDAKKTISGGTVKYIYMIKGEEKTETVNKILEENSSVQVIEIDPLNNISTEDKNDGKTYITIMNENIDKFKQELY